MIDVFLRVNKKVPSESWQRILTYKNENDLNQFVETLSHKDDVVNVEVIPVPDRIDKSYNEYLKEYFHGRSSN